MYDSNQIILILILKFHVTELVKSEALAYICAFCITNVMIQCLFHQHDRWIAKFKFN